MGTGYQGSLPTVANTSCVDAVALQPSDLQLTLPTGLFCLHTAGSILSVLLSGLLRRGGLNQWRIAGTVLRTVTEAQSVGPLCCSTEATPPLPPTSLDRSSSRAPLRHLPSD